MESNKVTSIVVFIQRIYLALIILGVFSLMSIAFDVTKKYSMWEVLPVVVVNTVIYFGLKTLKRWAVPLVLIYSALSLVGLTMALTQPASNMSSVLQKVFFVMLAAFYCYQGYFFSKQQVKKVFNVKGTTFFNL